MWQAKYRPRDYVPWGVIAGCLVVCGIIPLVIRWILVRENALRDREGHDPTYDGVYIEHITPEGKRVDVKIPKVRAPLHIFGVRSDPCPYAGIFGSHG